MPAVWCFLPASPWVARTPSWRKACTRPPCCASLQRAQTLPVTPAVANSTSDKAFDRADANGDGKLTLREAERYPVVAEQFSQLDRDKNGSLSREEFAYGIAHHP